jgi:DNA adenine methylase
MQYMGSKRRIAKDINAIMQPYYDSYDYYVEPFVGGGNMIKAVTHKNRTGYDINEYIIGYFNALKDGWLPPQSVTEEEYRHIRANKDNYPLGLVGFVGINCSFGGKWFDGYARNAEQDNYALRGYNHAIKHDIPNIQDINFIHSCYQNIEFKGKSIIYCDPPYKGMKQYRNKFNHDDFYQWLIDKTEQGHKIFISEYNMPDQFECVLSKEITCNIDNKNQSISTKTERLFTVRQ